VTIIRELCVFKIFYVKYFRKDIIKVQVIGSLYKHRLLHGKMKINRIERIPISYCFSLPDLRRLSVDCTASKAGQLLSADFKRM